MLKAKDNLKVELVQYSHFTSKDHVSPEVKASPRVIGLDVLVAKYIKEQLSWYAVLCSFRCNIIYSVHDGKMKATGHILRQSFTQRGGPLAGMGGGWVMDYLSAVLPTTSSCEFPPGLCIYSLLRI